MKTIHKILSFLVIIATFYISSNLLFQSDRSQEVTMDSNITTEAQEGLESTRERSAKGDVSFDIECVRKYSEKAGKTLEEIGTNEEEIEELLKEGYVAEAQKWLEYARKNTANGDVSFDIERVREYSEKAGKTLEEIGASEEEIEKLLKEGYIAEAQEWLEYARETVK